MSFQGTLGSTLKAVTEAEKDLAKRPDKVHAELSFAHYHWQRFSFTCGFAFKVNTAGIEASIFWSEQRIYRTGLCCWVACGANQACSAEAEDCTDCETRPKVYRPVRVARL